MFKEKIEAWEYFPPILKKTIKKEIKGKESYIFIVYILFNIN